MKKTERQVAIMLADKYCRLYILHRDGFRCAECGSKTNPTWGHVISRRHLATRWDELNSFCQCWSCNFLHTKDQYPFFNWFIEKYGKAKLDELYRKAHSGKKLSIIDILQIAEYYAKKCFQSGYIKEEISVMNEFDKMIKGRKNGNKYKL